MKQTVIIVGGGMAGISAAQAWHERGYAVTLFEQYFCGSQASGKSSGFITPESELNLSHFQRLVGTQGAQKIWNFGCNGGQSIKDNIEKYRISCDYQEQNTCVAANSLDGFQALAQEHELRTQLGYRNTLVAQKDLAPILGSTHYHGALISYDTFGINCYEYLQAMKLILVQQGAQIFEQTQVTRIEKQRIHTSAGSFTADYIVVCVDRFLPDLNLLSPDIYHAQTFIALSKPLATSDLKKIFPSTNLMVWDTDLIYTYYRIVDGNRLLVGGSDYWSIFWGSEQFHNKRMRNKLTRYVQKKFGLALEYEYFWPGLIGVSKDLMPIAGYDPNLPGAYCISGAAGLPWAAALGRYSVEKMIDGKTDFDHHFAPDRKYPLPRWTQYLLGKRLTFGLSNLIVELS